MTETDVSGSQPAIADAPVQPTEVPADPAPAVTDADEAATGKPPVQRRIDELTRLRREAERDRDHWREQAMRTTQARPAAEPDAPKSPPKLSDFNYDEAAYQAALVEHVKAETARQVREDLRKEETEKAKRSKLDTFAKRERDFAAKHEDYFEITRDSSLPITTAIAELVQDSDVGPEVLLYLANHRDECHAIAQMDDKAAARAIGRIEAKLESPAPAPAPKPAVSKAPPPTPKIEAVEPAVSKDPSEMTDAEFAKWRKRQIAQRR